MVPAELQLPGTWPDLWEGPDMRHGSRAIPTCTAQRDSGAFCDKPSLPDAPFPICVKHASQVLRYLNSYAPGSMDDRIILAVRMMEQDRAKQTERKRISNDFDVVYYVQVGGHIKIGYTSRLMERLRAYPPTSRLLAYEPGGKLVESQRHQQFADDLDAGREWFRPSEQLLAHINRIKAAHAA